MNKAFRIVWSYVRNAFVVVDEHTSARGKRNGSTQLLVGLGLGLAASGAQAISLCSPGSNTISTAETSTCYLYSDGSSLTVIDSGSITELGTPAVNSYASFDTISNAGSIITSGGMNPWTGAAILIQAGEGVESGVSISNLAGATIQGALSGITLDGNGYGLSVGSINNAGTIRGQAGIYAFAGATIESINNSGLIDSPSSVAIGLAGGSHIDSITNSGTIKGGIWGIATMNGSIDSIDNSGTIAGGQFAIDGFGSSIAAINIHGTSAHLIGDVFSNATSIFTLKSGARFSNENAIGVERFIIENGAILEMGAGASSSGYLDAGITTLSGFSNAGTMRLAAGTTGSIHGDYSQTDSGTLQIGVASDTSYGKLVVDGSATLTSNTNIVVDVASPDYNFSAQSLQDVLSAGTLVSDGTFAVSDNSQLFNFGAIKDGNTVDLTLAKAASVLDSVQSTGNTPAEGAANVLDETIANDPNGELATQFVGLTSEQEVSDAVTQTLPIIAGSTSNATGSTLAGINRVIQARQEDNSGLSSGDVPLTERNLWIKTFGSWADQDERSGVSGYDADTNGLAIGADAAVSETTRLGLAFAYAQTNVDNDSSVAPQDAQIDTFQLIGYGSYALAPDTDMNFQLDAGQNHNESKRHMPFADATAKADYDGYNVHAGIGIGHSLRLSEQLTFVPSVRADYTWIESESYHEKGASALNLDVDSNDAEELLLSVDGKVDYSLSEATILSANLGAGYDVIDEDSSITSTYAGSPGAAFKTPGMDMEPWLARAGLGLTHTLEGGTEVGLRYDVEVRSGLAQQGASLKARWAF